MKVLITGCAGFIGFHLTSRLLEKKKYQIYGIDNLNTYYDLKLKEDRIKILKEKKYFKFKKIDITNTPALNKLFKLKFDYVIHLAAQAGVRYSIEYPEQYLSSNIIGHYNLIDACRKNSIKHFMYASSSSVYGLSKEKFLKENQITDYPVSFYAASKKTNEVVTESFSKIYKLPATAIRFFTVYGPYGRPDMAPHLFTKAIVEKKKIKLFNYGNQYRDFTYIDDVTNFLERLITKVPRQPAYHRITNFGKGKADKITDFIKIIEKRLNTKDKIQKMGMQKGDVKYTCADIKMMKKLTNFVPKTSLEEGLNKFIDWYLLYYNIKK